MIELFIFLLSMQGIVASDSLGAECYLGSGLKKKKVFDITIEPNKTTPLKTFNMRVKMNDKITLKQTLISDTEDAQPFLIADRIVDVGFSPNTLLAALAILRDSEVHIRLYNRQEINKLPWKMLTYTSANGVPVNLSPLDKVALSDHEKIVVASNNLIFQLPTVQGASPSLLYESLKESLPTIQKIYFVSDNQNRLFIEFSDKTEKTILTQ